MCNAIDFARLRTSLLAQIYFLRARIGENAQQNQVDPEMETMSASSSLWRRHFVAVAGTPLLILIGLQLILRPVSEWDDVFVRAARDLMNGADIYHEGSAYLYPPFMAFAAIPEALMPHYLNRLIWSLFNVGAIIVAIRSAWKIAGGGHPALPTADNRSEWIAVSLALLCSLPFGAGVIANQQVDIVIAALVLCGCLWVLEKRERAGAILIGLGGAIKGPPLLFVAYFVARRRIDLALITLVVALAANLLPDLVHSSPDQSIWLQRWLHHFVIPTQGWNAEIGTWGTLPIYNQSLGSTLHRIAPQISASTAKIATYLILLAMCFISIAAAVVGQSRSRVFSSDKMPAQSGAEMGQVIALMLLMSPCSSPAHFGILILPALVLGRASSASRRPLLWVLLSAAAACGAVAGKDLMGDRLYYLFLNSGNVTLAALILWLGCTTSLLYGCLVRPNSNLDSWLLRPHSGLSVEHS